MALLNVVVDLSHHNTVTNFRDVKESGVLGIIHKATEGTSFVDAKYHERRPAALAAGLMWGAYHFGVSGDVRGQVDHFLNTVNPVATDLLVLDFEPNPREGTMTLAEAEEFVKQIHDRTGQFPCLYSGQSFIHEQLGSRTGTILSECSLWIACYRPQLSPIPPAFKTFSLWQYTDGNNGDQPHQVPGIGRCDRDKFQGDEAGLKKFWGVAGA